MQRVTPLVPTSVLIALCVLALVFGVFNTLWAAQVSTGNPLEQVIAVSINGTATWAVRSYKADGSVQHYVCSTPRAWSIKGESGYACYDAKVDIWRLGAIAPVQAEPVVVPEIPQIPTVSGTVVAYPAQIIYTPRPVYEPVYVPVYRPYPDRVVLWSEAMRSGSRVAVAAIRRR